jgi:TetR/AcrR family transcriptional regulator
MHLPLVELIRDTLKRGVREGVFRDDVDPINLYISIAGLSYFFFSNNWTLSAIFGTNLGDSKAVAVRRRHVIEFALGALRPLQP